MKKSNWQLLLMIIVCAAVYCWCLYRDIRIEKQYGCDLRNRVVGARLQKDGKLPYFYKWKPDDGLRYYDPLPLDTTYANAITASPFFHQLLYPVANLPQRQISKIWLAVQHCLFIGCMLFAFSFTQNIQQRWAVAITGMMFLFTTAWLASIYYSQIYLLYPFLCFALMFFFRRQHSLLFSFLAGLTAVTLILSRPTMVLFLLPFLFFINKFSLKYLLVFFTPVIILLGYTCLNAKERSFWIDYKSGVSAHMKDYLSNDRTERNKAFKQINYKDWEGWNQDSIKKERRNYPLHLKQEFSGVHAISKNVFNKEIPYQALTFCFATISFLLLAIFYIKRLKYPAITITNAAILGFCIYMLSDLFSPIKRSEYYVVQWIFPLLFCASFYSRRFNLFHLLLTLGVLLLILTTPYIKMRHTWGEFLILFTLLWFCLFKPSGWYIEPGTGHPANR